MPWIQISIHVSRLCTVTAEREGSTALDDSTAGRADASSEVALDAETTGLLTSRSHAAELTVLVDGVNNPVDAGVTADSSVGGINHDNLEVLEGSILSSPVRVQDTEVSAALSSTLLSDATKGAGSLDTLVLGLTVNNTLGVRALGGTTADTDTVDDVTLLSLVTETTSLVDTGRTRATVDSSELTVLPGTDTEDETHHIGLLLAPELFKILVSTCK